MTVSLWSLRAGQQGRIAGFGDGLPEHYRVRLMELGFHPGEQVSCLRTPAFGAPRVYQVANSVFSLDEDVAGQVAMEKTGQ